MVSRISWVPTLAYIANIVATSIWIRKIHPCSKSSVCRHWARTVRILLMPAGVMIAKNGRFMFFLSHQTNWFCSAVTVIMQEHAATHKIPSSIIGIIGEFVHFWWVLVEREVFAKR